jgi:hypothetical protein
MTWRGKTRGERKPLLAYSTCIPYVPSSLGLYVASNTVQCAVHYSTVLLVTARVEGEDVKHFKGPEGCVFGSLIQH